MNYLVSTFACMLVGDKNYTIEPYCKYSIDFGRNTLYTVLGLNGETPFIFDRKHHVNALAIEYNGDTYYYLTCHLSNIFMTQLKFMSHIVSVSISEKLFITVDGDKVCEEFITHLEYSHFEVRRNYLIIYFKGIREYVVIIKDKTLCVASYYDEINIVDGELIFMCRCYDSLNHGKVFYLNKNNEFDTYLVYLDNNDMRLKDEFVPFVFLDAIAVGNYKYANALLDDSIKLDDEKKLTDFFADYDDYLVLDNAFALIKKNTLAGIYRFEITNTKIVNIIQLE